MAWDNNPFEPAGTGDSNGQNDNSTIPDYEDAPF